ncbi:MAG: efflux RND transporter periplasmic adaptor subunit [Synergistaceae bacterium]|jgi:RND family efflux transporter MFP subunit|nr:efflux RND transporter periplasmic adaptor subunit [Synergistaceae bacterium]
MKKFFMGAMAVIIFLSIAFVGYGIYLNQTSDNHIETMMASRVVNVRGIRVSLRNIRPEIVLPRANFQTNRAADVIAPIEGTIDEVAAVQGQAVKRGQQLCTLVNRDIALQISRANTDVAKAQASYAQVRNEADRSKRLAERDAISQNELETATARLKAAEAELEATRIALRQLNQQKRFQTVTSPLDGFLVAFYKETGSYVQRGEPVAMVADFSHLMSRGQVTDAQIKNITPVDDVFLMRMDMSYLTEKALDMAFASGFEENFIIKTRIRNIDPPMSENAPLRIVTWEMENDRALLEPGYYTDVTISRNDMKNTLAVPLMLIKDIKNPSLHARDSNSKLAVRKVETGVYGEGLIEILSGIEEGDVVITSDIEGIGLETQVDVTLEDY